MLIPEYIATIWAMVAIAILMLVQVLVLDFLGIKAKHKPGTPVEADSNSLLFRATRAHSNTNETIAIFVLLSGAGVFGGAAPIWLAASSWAYVASRFVHMSAYYANRPMVRSIAFGFSLAALLAMLATVFKAVGAGAN